MLSVARMFLDSIYEKLFNTSTSRSDNFLAGMLVDHHITLGGQPNGHMAGHGDEPSTLIIGVNMERVYPKMTIKLLKC